MQVSLHNSAFFWDYSKTTEFGACCYFLVHAVNPSVLWTDTEKWHDFLGVAELAAALRPKNPDILPLNQAPSHTPVALNRMAVSTLRKEEGMLAMASESLWTSGAFHVLFTNGKKVTFSKIPSRCCPHWKETPARRYIEKQRAVLEWHPVLWDTRTCPCRSWPGHSYCVLLLWTCPLFSHYSSSISGTSTGICLLRNAPC